MHNEADTISINHNWFSGAAAAGVHAFLASELASTRAALSDLNPAAASSGRATSTSSHSWASSTRKLVATPAAAVGTGRTDIPSVPPPSTGVGGMTPRRRFLAGGRGRVGGELPAAARHQLGTGPEGVVASPRRPGAQSAFRPYLPSWRSFIDPASFLYWPQAADALAAVECGAAAMACYGGGAGTEGLAVEDLTALQPLVECVSSHPPARATSLPQACCRSRRRPTTGTLDQPCWASTLEWEPTCRSVLADEFVAVHWQGGDAAAALRDCLAEVARVLGCQS